MHALKGVVILMTVAIAVLMTLIIYGMYQKSQDPNFKFFNLSSNGEKNIAVPVTAPISGADQPAAAMAQPFGDIDLPLPVGAHIASASVSGNRLIVIVTGGSEPAGQVWVIDLGNGHVLGRVKAQP